MAPGIGRRTQRYTVYEEDQSAQAGPQATQLSTNSSTQQPPVTRSRAVKQGSNDVRTQHSGLQVLASASTGVTPTHRPSSQQQPVSSGFAPLPEEPHLAPSYIDDDPSDKTERKRKRNLTTQRSNKQNEDNYRAVLREHQTKFTDAVDQAVKAIDNLPGETLASRPIPDKQNKAWTKAETYCVATEVLSNVPGWLNEIARLRQKNLELEQAQTGPQQQQRQMDVDMSEAASSQMTGEGDTFDNSTFDPAVAHPTYTQAFLNPWPQTPINQAFPSPNSMSYWS